MSKILSLSNDANFYLYRKPVKMSRSFDGLAAIIRTELDKDIIGGDVFIFLNKQRTTIKIFVYENKGFSIFYRRLDEGSFQLPLIAADHVSYKMSAELLNCAPLHHYGSIKGSLKIANWHQREPKCNHKIAERFG